MFYAFYFFRSICLHFFAHAKRYGIKRRHLPCLEAASGFGCAWRIQGCLHILRVLALRTVWAPSFVSSPPIGVHFIVGVASIENGGLCDTVHYTALVGIDVLRYVVSALVCRHCVSEGVRHRHGRQRLLLAALGLMCAVLGSLRGGRGQGGVRRVSSASVRPLL